MCSYLFFFLSLLDLLALACSFCLFLWKCKSLSAGLPAGVPECATLNWESFTVVKARPASLLPLPEVPALSLRLGQRLLRLILFPNFL